MADRSGDRASSLSSETEVFDDNEKQSPAMSLHEGSYVKVKVPEEMEMGDDVERQELLPGAVNAQEKPQEDSKTSARAAIIWMVVNTLATIGIVCPYQFLLLISRYANFPPSRFLQTKPSSQISLSNSHNSPSPHSISSSHGLHSSPSPDPDSQCLCPEELPSRKSYRWLLPCL